MKTSSENPFFMGAYKVFNLFLINMMWLLLSIPLFTAGIAAAALLDTVHHEIRLQGGQPVQRFLSTLRRDFRQALPLGIGWIVLLGAEFADVLLFRTAQSHGAVYGEVWPLFGIALICTAVFGCYVFGYIANFRAFTSAILKNSLVLFFAHSPASLGIAAVLTATVLCIYIYPGTVFLAPVLAALVIDYLLQKVFNRYRPNSVDAAEDAQMSD